MKKLTKEQQNAYEALTRLQQGVAMAKLEGAKGGELVAAYRAVGGKAKSDSSARGSVAEILANPSVIEFIESVRPDPAETIAQGIMTRDQIRKDLSVIAKATIYDFVEIFEKPVVDVSGVKHDVFQSAVRMKPGVEIPDEFKICIKSIKQTKYGIEVVLHDGMAARKQLAEIDGHNAAQKHEITGANGGAIDVKLTPAQQKLIDSMLDDEC